MHHHFRHKIIRKEGLSSQEGVSGQEGELGHGGVSGLGGVSGQEASLKKRKSSNGDPLDDKPPKMRRVLNEAQGSQVRIVILKDVLFLLNCSNLAQLRFCLFS